MLAAAIGSLSALLVAPPTAALSAFDGVVQEHLCKNDDVIALVDSVRIEIQHTTDVAFGSLLTQTQVRRAPPARRAAP